MGDHDAPENWLDRWRETEPLRLYLYGITIPVLGAAVAYGWITTEQHTAWLAVGSAILLATGAGGELARSRVDSPTTRTWRLDEQHKASYAQGVEDAMHRTPETVAMERVNGRCRNIESGRRCILPAHDQEAVPHNYG